MKATSTSLDAHCCTVALLPAPRQKRRGTTTLTMSHAGGLDGVHHHDNARVRDRDSARDAPG